MTDEEKNKKDNSGDQPDYITPAWLKQRELNDISLKTIREKYEEISSTDTSISGTITAVNNSVLVIEGELYKNSKVGLDFGLLKSEIIEIRNQLADLEIQKASQLKSIKAVEEYINNNLQFMIIATQADGRIHMLEKQNERIEKRMEQIEDKASKKKDRSISIWAIAIAIVGLIVTTLLSILK